MKARIRHIGGQAASLALVLGIGVAARTAGGARAGASLIALATFAWPAAYWSEMPLRSLSRVSRVEAATSWFALALLAATSRSIPWHGALAAVLLVALAIRFALLARRGDSLG